MGEKYLIATIFLVFQNIFVQVICSHIIGGGFFKLDKIFISLPICRTFFSHSASIKQYIYFSGDKYFFHFLRIFLVHKVWSQTIPSINLEVKKPSERGFTNLMMPSEARHDIFLRATKWCCALAYIIIYFTFIEELTIYNMSLRLLFI